MTVAAWLGAGMLGSAVAAPAATALVADACADPLEIYLGGLPPQPPAQSRLVLCGDVVEQTLFDARHFVGDAAAYSAQLARAPSVSATRTGQTLTLELVLRDGTSSRRYRLEQLPLAKAVSLRADPDAAVHAPAQDFARVDHIGGPSPTAALVRLDEQAYVGLEWVDVTAQRAVRELARIKQLTVRGSELLDDKAPVTLRFPAVAVASLMQLAADISSVGLQRDVAGAFDFRRSRDAQALARQSELIDSARASEDATKLATALEKWVELARPDDAADLELDTYDSLGELAKLAVARQQSAAAEAWQRQRLAQAERLHGAESTPVALVLAELALLRVAQDDKPGAQKLIERAQRCVDKAPQREAGKAALTLSTLAEYELLLGRAEQAAALNARAVTRLTHDFSNSDAQYFALDIAGRLFDSFVASDQRKLAQPQTEHMLTLAALGRDETDADLDTYRSLVISNLIAQGRRGEASRWQERQIALTEQRADPLSATYATALIELATYRAQQDRLADAISLWRRVVDLRRRVLGNVHPTVVAGLQDLALLQRLSGDEAAAQTTAREVAAGIQALTQQEPVLRADELADAVSVGIALALEAAYSGLLMQHERDGDIDALRLARANDALSQINTERYLAVWRADAKLRATAGRSVEPGPLDAQFALVRGYAQKALDLRLQAQGAAHADTLRSAKRLLVLHELVTDAAASATLRERVPGIASGPR